MSRSNRDIGGYRGRRTLTDILKLIAAVLAVLVVLAIAGVIYLQRYLVYTDEGAKLELPPFLQILRGEKEPGGAASLPDPGSLSIGIQPAGSQSEPQTPEEPVEPVPAGFAMQLTLKDVKDGTASAKLEEAGAAQLILEVKDPQGQLAWLSGRPEAARAKVNGTQADTDVLRQWNTGEVYTVARVCCFRDNKIPYHHNTLSLSGRSGNWGDEQGVRWLSPANEDAQAYVVGLCGELAELGFDEIVLEQFGFPTQGRLERITTGRPEEAGQRTQVVEEFLTQVRKAVEPYGTKLSLRVERDTLAGMEDLSGITPGLLDEFAGRVWTDEEGARLLKEQPANTLGRMVEIVGQAEEDSPVFQAVLPAG